MRCLSETSGGSVSFNFEVPEGGTVLVDEVVVPGEGAALDAGEVVGHELLDPAAKSTDGLGRSVGRWYGVKGLAGYGEQ